MPTFVVYWNNIPSPYMIERFNAIADSAPFEFEVWFNDRSHVDRNWAVEERTWRFRYRYVPVTCLARRRYHWPLMLLGRRRPDVLVCLYSEPSFVVGWALAKIRGAKTVFRVLMTHDRWVPRHPLREAIKRLLFRNVDAVETPGGDGKKYAMRYGASSERIFFATHTVDIPHFKKGVVEAQPDRDSLRQKLGLKGPTFLYCGRLWWGKGVGYLLDAFEKVQNQFDTPVSFLILGDGPDEGALRLRCAERGIQNVVFAGFKQKPELPQYYNLADVFVFPTLGDPYGLVVDEAMACSLPVISTSAAGEIRDRVEDGVNGYIVPPEDSTAMAERMQELAEDGELRTRMGRVSAQKVEGRTPEQWAKDFEEIVYSLLK